MPDLKICTKCGKKKSLSEFVKERARADGLRPDCKDCLDWNEFVKMLEDQDYKCAICNQEITATAKQSDRKTVAQVDHNHTTGHLRGLLCNACNVGVGMFQDSQFLILQASEYLKHFDGEEDA